MRGAIIIPCCRSVSGRKDRGQFHTRHRAQNRDFVTEAANSDMFEIQSSKVATKGDARRKAFFRGQMVKDHTTTSTELKALVGSGKVQVELPAALDKTHRANSTS